MGDYKSLSLNIFISNIYFIFIILINIRRFAPFNFTLEYISNDAYKLISYFIFVNLSPSWYNPKNKKFLGLLLTFFL